VDFYIDSRKNNDKILKYNFDDENGKKQAKMGEISKNGFPPRFYRFLAIMCPPS
jgi:hypothetical protein